MANTIKTPTRGNQSYKVYDLDGNVTLKEEDFPCLVSNQSAAGAAVVTLPSAPRPGLVISAVALAAQALRLDPGASDAVICRGAAAWAKQTDGKYVEGATAGHQIELVSNEDGDWVATKQLDGAGAVGFNTIEA